MKAAAAKHQASGWLHPHIDRKYALENVSSAHKDVIDKSGTVGNLVITIRWFDTLFYVGKSDSIIYYSC